MLTKKYLYEGNNEYLLYNNIISQNINDKLSKNEELNDLLIKMLKININERISWEEYFNHPFFKLNEFPKSINIMNIKDNYILCEYNIKNEDLNKDIQILNYLNEELKKNFINVYKQIGKTDYILEINKDEINCTIYDLYLNNERINFSYKYKFEKEGKYSLKILFKRSIKNISYMFQLCSSLTSLNLSNFKTNNVQNMICMFNKCSSLISLNLSNFNTNNVKDMSYMFSECSSLLSLNLNTNNFKYMNYLFNQCSSLTSLNLSNFNINNVQNMKAMLN